MATKYYDRGQIYPTKYQTTTPHAAYFSSNEFKRNIGPSNSKLPNHLYLKKTLHR